MQSEPDLVNAAAVGRGGHLSDPSPPRPCIFASAASIGLVLCLAGCVTERVITGEPNDAVVPDGARADAVVADVEVAGAVDAAVADAAVADATVADLGRDMEGACPDTVALAPGAAGPFAPATRITTLEVPSSPQRAQELACRMVDGSNEGTGLSGLLRLLMLDIGDLVRRDEEDGSIQLILLGHLDGWNAGETGEEASNVRLVFYSGEADGDAFRVARASFQGGDPANAPRSAFRAVSSCSRLVAYSGTFELDVPVRDSGVALGLTLSATTLFGNLRAEATGFSVRKGTINGYLTFESIVALLTGVKAACESADPPSFCEQAGQFLAGDPEPTARTLVLPILRGLDSKVAEDGSVSGDCIGDGDCNAVSVCFAFESGAATITGIAP